MASRSGKRTATLSSICHAVASRNGLGPAVGRMRLMLTFRLARLPLIASLVARPSGRPEVRMRGVSSVILGLTVLALAGPGVAQSPEPRVNAFSLQGTVKQVRQRPGSLAIALCPGIKGSARAHLVSLIHFTQ